MERREIQFFNSMNADKRNQNLAYLVNNVAGVGTVGLYPAKNFTLANGLVADGQVIDIIGYDDGGLDSPKVIVWDDTANLTRFYELGRGSSEKNDSTPLEVRATAFGDSGVFLVMDDNKVYQPSYNNSNLIEEATFPSSPNVEIGGFDGVYYWWVGTKMWRQLEDDTPELMMSQTGFDNPMFVAFWRDDMFVYNDRYTNNDFPPATEVFIWDKKNTTFFKKRLVIRNEKLLAGGVVGNVPLLVTHRRSYQNRKEAQGFIVIYGYNGENFVELNKIKAGSDELAPPQADVPNACCKTNEHYMIFAVRDNEEGTADPEKDLYKNYIYKVYVDGSIQALTCPADDLGLDQGRYPEVVGTFAEGDAYGMNSIVGVTDVVIMDNTDTSRSQGSYTDFGTTYITNFLTNPYNRHKLTALSFSFEKLVNEEELDIYYRTSDREAWTLLVNVTPQKVIDNANLRLDPTVAGTAPMPQQRYQVTKMPDGSALPEFNEIQFKIVSRAGFSIIGMWFEYDYLTRVTKR